MDLILSSLLKEFAAHYNLQDQDECDVFEHFVNYCVISRLVAGDFDLEGIRVGYDKTFGIDGAAIIVNEHLAESCETIDEIISALGRTNVQFIFTQAKTSDKFDTGDIAKFLFAATDFFNEHSTIPKNEDLRRLIDLQRHVYEHSSRMRDRPSCLMYYATTGTWADTPELNEIINVNNTTMKNTNLFDEIRFVPLGRTELQDIYRRLANPISCEINFPNHIILPSMEKVREARIGLLPATEYVKLICDNEGLLQRSLFYENIRDFQGNNQVNLEITQTLHDTESKQSFALLNNGITIVAQDLKQIGSRFNLFDYQIVNGCQTSHVLYHNRHILDQNTHIAVKIIVTQDQDLTTKIIKATNRQTEIKVEAFVALEPFHKELERFFASFTIEKRLYYERRSKQYDRESVSRASVITLSTQLSCFLSMFLEEPHSTHRYYGELLKSYTKRVFQRDHSCYPYFVSAYALTCIEDRFRRNILEHRLRRFKFHLIMLVRILYGGDTPHLQAKKKMDAYCDKLMELFKKDEDVELAFRRACEIVDEVLKREPGLQKEAERRREFTSKLIEAATDGERSVPIIGKAKDSSSINGSVKWYNEAKGYGFILDEDGKDVFFHISEIPSGDKDPPQQGEQLCFNKRKTPRGISATNITRLKLSNR